MNEQIKKLKQKYIPLCVQGLMTEKECAKKIGITTRTVSNLMKRFRIEGTQCFEHKNKGKISSKKIQYSDEQLIVNLYIKEYNNFEFRKFCRILKTKFNKAYSYSVIADILKRNNIQSPLISKYKRLYDPNPSDYISLFHDLCENVGYDGTTDYNKFLKQIDIKAMDKYRIYASLFLCDCLYNAAFLQLKKILKINEHKNKRTSYSVFEYCISKKYFDISSEWEHWNEYHKYFSLSYTEETRKSIILSVYNTYFPMFHKIYKYFSDKQT